MPTQDVLQLDSLNVVNRTCRATAAMRAQELLRNSEHAIIRDELAVHLAGDEAMERYGQYWERSVRVSQLAPNKPQHSYFAGRSRILDDMTMSTLQQFAAKQTSQQRTAAAQQLVEQQQPTSCQFNSTDTTSSSGSSKLQVVSLGCGLDTRPWRLEFPEAHVAWFDVDQQPVLDLKAALLQQAGAELHPKILQQQQGSDAYLNSDDSVKQPAHSISCQGDSRSFPLKCSSYSMVSVDLSSGSWMQELHSAGFEPGTPTLWIAEGLLYYLNPREVMQLLHDISVTGTAGSTAVLATHIPFCNLDASRNAPDGVGLKGLFKSCYEDLQQDQLQKAGWGVIRISKDVGVILAEDYGAQVLYPYSLEYSGGKRLEGIESVVEMRLT